MGYGEDDSPVDLPPPPPIPANVVPIKAESEKSNSPEQPVQKSTKPKRLPMARRGIGTKGQQITLLTNHFKVALSKVDGEFFHYNVELFYEDDRPVDGKGVGRKVLDKVYETYDTMLSNKQFAYDGEKSLFTVGPLPQNKMDFTVVLDENSSNRASNGNSGGDEETNDTDRKRTRRSSYNTKTFKVVISYAAKIRMQAIAEALRGMESEKSQEALRVLDIILRQHAAKRNCLLVRQSFFDNDHNSFTDLGGGVNGARGFHSSFRTTQGGLSLNIDVTTTMIYRPGPVLDFLCNNQNVRNPREIRWDKAKRTLKNLRVKVAPTNMEYKISGLSELPCSQQLFTLKKKDCEPEDVTVYDYFIRTRRMNIDVSQHLPCINVGKPKRPTYIPVELCTLVPLQRYTKALSTLQRSSLVEKSRQKPNERMRVLTDALKKNRYDEDKMLQASGISISTQFTEVIGRVLTAPKLTIGNGGDFFPRNARWNFNNKTLVEPVTIKWWAVVNFSARCNTRQLIDDLIRCGHQKGVEISAPYKDVIEENRQDMRTSPQNRVRKMFEQLEARLPGEPQFLLCILPERKNSDIYGPWKKMSLADKGVPTQCIAPMKVNDQYLTNVLLKINAKLNGMNSFLTAEHPSSPFLTSKTPTLILGMDVSHGSPGQSDVPSIAAVVSSRKWPLISRYRAAVRTQSPKTEMIDNLFKINAEGKDEGIIQELLQDFWISSNRRPEQIVIFRDGVSESQFNQVLNIELDQIIEACKFKDGNWNPKFTVIIAQKNHHTKFFQTNSPDNVPPGTVIDNRICHPQANDFYMCAHAGMIGTTRPTHYHVLYDEIGFSPDDLQELVHSLSYVYQRSTTATSVVAPVCYAHLAAAQMGQFLNKIDDFSETSSGHGGPVPFQAMPKLHSKVANSMFFC
ncbi:hypothetical protein GIB67_024777 [Kingdonia uniflora]|uniref:Argonaute 4 n=1 Tax=Kingdonia uniflora TaxID=39325 RepID=A0A7J7NA99_9MAGN|nr:hypothetical protein GIB67_024777 [Kingdonia uniflora]